MDDEKYIIDKLEKIDTSLTHILVEQGKTSVELSKHINSTNEDIKELQKDVKNFKETETKVTKIESTVGILKWVLTSATAILIAVAAKIITDLLGG